MTKTYKLRKGTIGNSTGDNFCLTVPKDIVSRFAGVEFEIFTTTTMIVYASGCRHEKDSMVK